MSYNHTHAFKAPEALIGNGAVDANRTMNKCPDYRVFHISGCPF